MSKETSHGVFLGQRVSTQSEDYIRMRIYDEDETSPKLTPRLKYLTAKYCESISVRASLDSNVIEIGIGTGASILPLLRTRPDLTVTGVDINSQRLERAEYRLRSFCSRVNLIEQDAASYLHSHPNTGDIPVIASANTLHNLEISDRAPILSAVVNSLKPKGWFIDFDKHEADDITTAEKNFKDRLARFAHKFTDDNESYSAWVRHFEDDHRKDQPRNSYLSYLGELGFSGTQIIDANSLEIIVAAER